ncbi:MAG: hypothetical protein SF339_08970 [Blastocatellia bacterium]|nr:hypothetical protein [Blastocatellia bacterium]
MRRFITALILIVTAAVAGGAQTPEAKLKAEGLLKQAREAIGSEKKWKELQSITATGLQRQTMGDRQMENEVTVDLMTPDKIMTTYAMQFGGNPIGTRISTLNGDQTWNDFIPGMGMGGGGGMARMMGGGGGGQGGPGGNDPNSPMAKYFQMSQRRDLVLVMLGWLLTPPPSAQLEFAYAGEAPGPEGAKLDAIVAKSPQGMNFVLYLNQESHQLVGIKYKAKQTRMIMGGGRGPGGQPGQPGGQPGQPGGQRQGGNAQPGQPGGQRQGNAQPGQGGQRPEMTPEERERRMKEAQERFEKAPEVDISWAFSEYKNVGGFNFPHRMTKSEGGTPNEEWEISKFKINPKLTADKFIKKEKDKASTN